MAFSPGTNPFKEKRAPTKKASKCFDILLMSIYYLRASLGVFNFSRQDIKTVFFVTKIKALFAFQKTGVNDHNDDLNADIFAKARILGG